MPAWPSISNRSPVWLARSARYFPTAATALTSISESTSGGKRKSVELIDDLTARFLDEFAPDHERDQVASYRPYFLGPIVTAQRDAIRYLVDGQQRITTLTLLLIHLRRLLQEQHHDDRDSLTSLIFSAAFGRKTYNLDVEERAECLDAILGWMRI